MVNSNSFLILFLSLCAWCVFVCRKFIHGCGAVGHLEDVVVDCRARGLGLARCLVSHVLCVARRRRCYKVILDCATDLETFYGRSGYATKGIQMAHYFE